MIPISYEFNISLFLMLQEESICSVRPKQNELTPFSAHKTNPALSKFMRLGTTEHLVPNQL